MRHWLLGVRSWHCTRERRGSLGGALSPERSPALAESSDESDRWTAPAEATKASKARFVRGFQAPLGGSLS